MTDDATPRPNDPLFAGQGELRAACRALDWAATPLGPSDRWPQALRTVARLCLDGATPMAVCAGPELTLLYNDPAARLLGLERHHALGRPAGAVPHLWDRLGPALSGAFERGEAVCREAQPFAARGQGAPSEVRVTYACAPVREDDGRIVGVLAQFHEAAPRESEVPYRALLDNALDAAYQRDLNLDRYDYMSPVIERITGYTAEEVQAMSLEHVLGLVHPEDLPAIHARLAQPPASRGAALEYRLRCKDGTYRWLSDLAVVQPGPDGRPAWLVGSVSDVTERKRAEAALKASEERFRTVVENSRDGINLLDLRTGRYVFMSPSQVELTGFTAEEMNRLSVEEACARVHPADREIWVRQQKQVAEGQDLPEAVEYRWRVKSGEYRWFSDTRKLVRDAHGQPVALVGVSRDVTDRRRAEEALREREAQFRALVENVSAGVALVDSSGRFTRYNPQFLAMFGLDADSNIHNVNSRDWSAWQVFDEAGRLLHVDEHPVRKAVLTRRRVRNQLVQVRLPAGGDRLWMVVSAEPLFDAAGGMAQVICTYHDVTARERAEAALRESQGRALAALREADRQKSEFIAVLSHELRNPLAPIRNSLFVLERADPGGDQAKKAQAVIARQVAHLTRLVDDLLDATRIARGKVSLKRERLDLRRVVSGTVEDHVQDFAAAGVALEAALAPDALWLDGDATRLAQLVGNLLHNAAKFTPPGGRVSVTLRAESGAAVLRVEDDGVGIAQDQIGRIFEAFTQVEQPLDRKRGGLGLGLALVKGFVELHGGTLEAASDGLGRGARFTVRLPLAKASTVRASPGL